MFHLNLIPHLFPRTATHCRTPVEAIPYVLGRLRYACGGTDEYPYGSIQPWLRKLRTRHCPANEMANKL